MGGEDVQFDTERIKYDEIQSGVSFNNTHDEKVKDFPYFNISAKSRHKENLNKKLGTMYSSLYCLMFKFGGICENKSSRCVNGFDKVEKN